MKIVLISPAHPLRGGIAASSERLALELMDAGHEVVLYSFSLQYPEFLFPGKTQFSDEPAPPRLTIKTRINAINPFNWVKVGWEIAQERADLHIVRYWLPLMGPCLGTLLRFSRWFSPGKPRITALCDNIIPHEKRPGDRLFSAWFIGACHDFVVMSREVERQIKQFLPAKSKASSSVVRFAEHPIYDIYGAPMDMATARALLALPLNKKLILFFGFIRPYKGLDLLLEALSQCPETIELVVAGECYGSWEGYAEQLKRLQLENRVHLFTDFIPTQEVAHYFSAADLVVQPYKSATQSGISQIAFHFDKPMIVTRVGGLPEIVRDGVSGLVVEPDPVAIAAAIRRFFDQDLAQPMRDGVRKEKWRFSWENLAGQLVSGF